MSRVWAQDQPQDGLFEGAMMNLQEHADKIKAAFEAAEKDGFVLSFEWEMDPHADNVLDSLSLDINRYEWTEYAGERRRAIMDWVVLREESF